MSNDIVEVLDANIVIIPDGPLTQTMNAVSLFEEGKLASFMRKPLTFGQGLSLDVTIGTTIGTYQIESMRSQKVIVLSPLRIEAHDRSGELSFEKAQLPETVIALTTMLHVEGIKAIGANWDIMFKTLGTTSASAAIAERFLRQDTSFLPHNMTSVGGAVRLFLADSFGEYTLAIEPQGQNAYSGELRMNCNANVSFPKSLSIELLKDIFRQSYSLLFQVKESLFSTS